MHTVAELQQVIRIGQTALGFNAGPTVTGWETNVAFGVFNTVVLVGFGWDVDHPLRPWPWFTSRATVKGNHMRCLSCCGFFVSVGWKP